MAQIFQPRANTIAKASIFGAVMGIGALSLVAAAVDRSPYVTNEGVVRDQPVPFSHEHHVRGLGLDCRYCHTSVSTSQFAGMPPTKTCMTCHSKIWTDAPLLEPVRQSWSTSMPLKWTRVHNLPDFVYFQHDIHVAKGVGCVTCHGQVDQMPLMWQNASLQMQWCLDCHYHPEKYLRPREAVFSMNYAINDEVKKDFSDANHSVTDQISLGKVLIDEYHIPTDGRLTNCYTCHR
ncbi:MAG: cytochrome c family protein [Planctomycetota bacterium]|nr:cytochrome c family protein [Planctomycetota bacterium]